jgi:hypothetical protein
MEIKLKVKTKGKYKTVQNPKVVKDEKTKPINNK